MAAKLAQEASPPIEEPFVPSGGMVRETPLSPPSSSSGSAHIGNNGAGASTDTTTPTAPEVYSHSIHNISWSGEIPPLKWMTFYSKVLSKFTLEKGLKLSLHVEIAPDGGLSKQKVDETRVALRELGLSDDLEIL